MNLQFRDLTADDVECRVARVTDKGCQLLLYKNARCDMAILDETVGAENWTRSHEVINDNLFCNVGIKCEKDGSREFGEWVFKQDVGTESYTEKEKGEASDSFKRACFNWGIGRELYTAPFIWVKAENVNITDKKTNDKFSVDYMEVVDKKIVALSISNTSKRVEAFKFGKVEYSSEKPKRDDLKKQCENYAVTISNLIGVGVDEVKKQAVELAKSKDLEKICTALANWLLELNKGN